MTQYNKRYLMLKSTWLIPSFLFLIPALSSLISTYNDLFTFLDKGSDPDPGLDICTVTTGDLDLIQYMSPCNGNSFCTVQYRNLGMSPSLMANLHWQRHIRVWTRIRIKSLMATLYYAEHVHIAQTWTQIPTPYFCVGQVSESESVPESVSGNVNEPWVGIRDRVWQCK